MADIEPIQPETKANPYERLLRLKALTEMLGVSKGTVYKLMETEGLPKPIRLGANSMAWKLSQVQAWIESRPEFGEVA
ncbi:MAG: AlpA family phage regulatory protein [Gammaproteobacteria bacterium]|nr:AlpA family phage regulatory protein [Gammaproteobacteria bacterium]